MYFKKNFYSIINNRELQFSTLIVLFFISDSFTKIGKLSHFSFYNYSALIKGLFCLFSISFSLLYFRKTNKQLFYLIGGSFFIFIIGQFFFNGFSLGENIFKNFIFFSRYMFAFIILLYFQKTLSKSLSPRVFKIFEYIVVFNSLLILLGFIFKIPLFQTYSPNRFGYNGLYIVPSASTYFYSLSLTYFSYIFYTKKKKLAQLLLVITACFLTGTKALFLFLVLTTLHFIYLKKIYKKKSFYVLISVILITIYLMRDILLEFFQKHFNVFTRLYDEYGLITMLTSYRDLNLKKNFLPTINEKWNVINYLFGGTDFEKYRVEFEIYDIILFWGILGGVCYLYFYNRFILKVKKLSPFGKKQILFLLVIALLSGTFFNNGPLVIYLLVVLNFLHFKTTL